MLFFKKIIHKKLLTLFGFCLFPALYAQNIQDKIQVLIEDYVSENEDSNIDIELLYEVLFELYENPININNASSEALEKIPFLSAFQVNALLDYAQRHAPIRSIYELQGVYAFDQKIIENIAPFIVFEETERYVKKKMYFKHEVLLRSATVVEKQEGYVRPDTVSHYRGKPYSLMLKYKGERGKKYAWHLTAEQDRGEPWFAHAPVADFLSVGLQYNGKGRLQKLILGDYRMSLGQGLVLNNNFGYGKSAQVMNVMQKGQKLRRSTSSAEFGMFRGVATQVNFGKFDFAAGISSRMADASLDSIASEAVISAFPTAGLHRTDSEIKKYRTARVSDAVAHLTYTHKRLKAGATLMAQHLSHTFSPGERWDTYFNPTYRDYHNISLDYKWSGRGGVFLFGEVATDKQKGLAVLQGLNLYPSSRVGMSLLYRYYSKDYFSPYAQAFGEGSRVSNEEGLYMGTNISISKAWAVNAYLDWYRFPWLRYGLARPTSGYDVLVEPVFAPSRRVDMHWRFKYEEKESNLSTNMPTSATQNTQRLDLRYHLSLTLSDRLSLKSRVATAHALHLENENGYLIYQDVKGKMLREKLVLTLRYALFNTSSYASRIYIYEPNVLYLSSVPAYSGRGSRSFLNAAYKLNDTFAFYFRIAYTKNFQGKTMGSALEAINADHKTDLHFQVRIKL